MGKMTVALGVLAMGVLAGTADEPVRGRVAGMYCLNKEASPAPAFPFRAQWQLNTYADSSNTTSKSDAAPDMSRLSAEDLASLPTNAFVRTGYVHPGDKRSPDEFVFPNLTPGAVYRMDVYVNEPYHEKGDARSQNVRVNGVNLKDAEGKEDFVLSPFAVAGGKGIVGKVSFDVSAGTDGKVSLAFPRVMDQSALNVVTLAGTNRPGAVAWQDFAVGAEGLSLVWRPTRDTLAYYVERQTGADDATWETVAATVETNAAVVVDAAAETRFRVVSSNGLGTATGPVATYGVARRMRYAVNVGGTEPCAWFVPARAALASNFEATSYDGTLYGVDGRYATAAGIYRTLGTTKALDFAFSNLTANAVYTFRTHVVETDWNAAKDGRTRPIDIATNGTHMTTWDALAAAGRRCGGVAYRDLAAAADEHGTLAVSFARNAASSYSYGITVCALEVFARDDEPFEAVPPAPVLTAFAEGVRIVPETRHAQNTYTIQYLDTAAEPEAVTDGTVLARGVPVTGFMDFAVPADGSRWYRVRAEAGEQVGAWSPWLRGARGDRSLAAPLRVNFTEKYADQTPEGWVNDAPYRTGHTEGFEQSPDKTTAFTVKQGAVPDQAPDLIYLTGIFAREGQTDKQTYRFFFPGFDAAQTYRLRLHLLENWTGANIGTRVFSVAVNRSIPAALKGIDVLKLAGGEFYRPVVVEDVVRPALDGSIRLDVVRGNENPTFRGAEFIPVDTAGVASGTGRVAFTRAADDTPAGNAEETFVAERACNPLAWEWRAADVPAEAGERPRLLARGRLYVPMTETYTAATTAEGMLNLWVDGEGWSANVPQTLAAGPHDVYVEYLPTSRAACAAQVAWKSASGLKPQSLQDAGALTYPDGWRFIQIGSAPGAAFVRGTAEGRWRMAASGGDMWGGSDSGTFLYRAAGKAPFDCSFRVTGVGGAVAEHTRVGVMVRSSLKAADASGFVFYAGLNGANRLCGYGDVTLGDAFNIVSLFGVEAADHGLGSLGNPPFTVRATRERLEAGNDRFVLSFMSADGSYVYARTQELARAANVYVGPLAMAHYTVAPRLVQYEFDSLSFEDTTPQGLFLLIR